MAKRALEVATRAARPQSAFRRVARRWKDDDGRRMPVSAAAARFEEALDARRSLGCRHAARGHGAAAAPSIRGRITRSQKQRWGAADRCRVPAKSVCRTKGSCSSTSWPNSIRRTLEALRQPLEEGRITITRAARTASLPARFMLLAAMNPCPCGFRGDPRRQCRCSDPQVHRYAGRISGPLRDRIDLVVDVPAAASVVQSAEVLEECSEDIRRRVMAARARQLARFPVVNFNRSSRACVARSVRLDRSRIHSLIRRRFASSVSARAVRSRAARQQNDRGSCRGGSHRRRARCRSTSVPVRRVRLSSPLVRLT